MGNCFYDMPFLPEFPTDPDQPSLTEGRARILSDVQSFPRRYWDPDYVGLALLPEFAGLRWEKEIPIDPPPAPDSDETREEIQELLALMKERQHARAEIVAQSADFPLYWLGLLMMSRSSHPAPRGFHNLCNSSRPGNSPMAARSRVRPATSPRVRACSRPSCMRRNSSRK